MKHALRCGNLLIKAKATVPHGHWLPWLRKNIAFSDRTAQGYTRIAQRFSRLQMRGSVADLSVRGALKELATPQRHAMMDDFAAWTERSRVLSDQRPTDSAAWSIDDVKALVKSIGGFDEIMHRYGLCEGDDDLSDLCLVCSTEDDRPRTMEPSESISP